MIKRCKKIFKRKEIHDFDAIFYAKLVDCFVFWISYTIPEIIEKNTKKWFYKKPYKFQKSL